MIIETRGLTKQYRGNLAVQALDLRVEQGTISAFLGPNGSGKTTTIRMLLGLARPTAGEAFVFGEPASDEAGGVRIRQRTGYVGEDKRLYGYMTVDEIIRFVRSANRTWNRDREQTLVKRFDLERDRKCKKLSKGMRTKVALVLALSRCPDLLILDEPSEGLDPVAVEQLLEAVVQAAAEGTTVFFSTHQISEVERIADDVFIMNRGRLVCQNSIEGMRESYRRVHFAFPGGAPLEEMSLKGVQSLRAQNHVLSVVVSDNLESVEARGRALGAISVDVQPMNLRELFLESVSEDPL